MSGRNSHTVCRILNDLTFLYTLDFIKTDYINFIINCNDDYFILEIIFYKLFTSVNIFFLVLK